jgi:hypothetical protein
MKEFHAIKKINKKNSKCYDNGIGDETKNGGKIYFNICLVSHNTKLGKF